MSGDEVVNYKPGVLLVIECFPVTSIMEVTRSVEKALDVMRPGLPDIYSYILVLEIISPSRMTGYSSNAHLFFFFTHSPVVVKYVRCECVSSILIPILKK